MFLVERKAVAVQVLLLFLAEVIPILGDQVESLPRLHVMPVALSAESRRRNYLIDSVSVLSSGQIKPTLTHTLKHFGEPLQLLFTSSSLAHKHCPEESPFAPASVLLVSRPVSATA